MPMTNDAFCLGFRSRGTPWATNPYPQRSSDHWAWEKGRHATAMPTAGARRSDEATAANLALLEIINATG